MPGMSASGGDKTRIYLVDDHPLLRESLANLINQQADMTVCGEAETANHALGEMSGLMPDLAIMDLSLKESSGLELIKISKAKMPNMAIIVLSMHEEEMYAERCIRAGASGYVMKRESSTRITAAVRDALAGRLTLSDRMSTLFARKFVGGHAAKSASPIQALSDRELEVFGLMGQGLGTRQVADNLNVSIKTVQAYCARIKQKLNLATATELLREAVHWHDQNSGADIFAE